MSGIYINGLSMPTSCRPSDCPLTGWACKLWKSVNNSGEKKERHKDCPIVEINGPAFIVEGTAWTQDGIVGAPVITLTERSEE